MKAILSDIHGNLEALQAVLDDIVRRGRLAVLPRPRSGDWLVDEVRSLRASGVDVLVSLFTRDEAAELDLVEEAARMAGSCAERAGGTAKGMELLMDRRCHSG